MFPTFTFKKSDFVTINITDEAGNLLTSHTGGVSHILKGISDSVVVQQNPHPSLNSKGVDNMSKQIIDYLLTLIP